MIHHIWNWFFFFICDVNEYRCVGKCTDFELFYHVDDLRQRNLQGHVQNVVCVFHRPQCAGVVGKQVSQQLLSIFPMSSPTGYNRKGSLKSRIDAVFIFFHSAAHLEWSCFIKCWAFLYNNRWGGIRQESLMWYVKAWQMAGEDRVRHRFPFSVEEIS